MENKCVIQIAISRNPFEPACNLDSIAGCKDVLRVEFTELERVTMQIKNPRILEIVNKLQSS